MHNTASLRLVSKDQPQTKLEPKEDKFLLLAGGLNGDLDARHKYESARQIGYSELPKWFGEYLYNTAKSFYLKLPLGLMVKWDQQVLLRALGGSKACSAVNPMLPLRLTHKGRYERPAFQEETFRSLGIDEPRTLFEHQERATKFLSRDKNAKSDHNHEIILIRAADGNLARLSDIATGRARAHKPVTYYVQQCFDPSLIRPDGVVAAEALSCMVKSMRSFCILSDYLKSEGIELGDQASLSLFHSIEDPWKLKSLPEISSLQQLKAAIQVKGQLPLHQATLIYSTFLTDRNPVEAALNYFEALKQRSEKSPISDKPLETLGPTLTALHDPEKLGVEIRTAIDKLYPSVEKETRKETAKKLKSLVLKGLATKSAVIAGIESKYELKLLPDMLRRGSYIPQKQTVLNEPALPKVAEDQKLRVKLFGPEHSSKDYACLNYSTPSGEEPFTQWLETLDHGIKQRIQQEVEKLRRGLFGDSKDLGHGVTEFRADYGGGVRVYFAYVGQDKLVLLFGGNKASQERDIPKAIEYFHEYKSRC